MKSRNQFIFRKRGEVYLSCEEKEIYLLQVLRKINIQDLVNKGILRKEAQGGRSTNYELIIDKYPKKY